MDALTKSSVDSLLEKIRHLASRPVPEFNRFEALDLLEALKNAAQDTKHEKAGYFRLAFETLRGKADEPNDQFRNFLLPLLGDKDQEKVLEVVAKVEKNNRRKSVRQNSGPGRRAMAAPYMGVRCYYCNRPGHIQIIVSNGKEIWAGLLVFPVGLLNQMFTQIRINREITV